MKQNYYKTIMIYIIIMMTVSLGLSNIYMHSIGSDIRLENLHVNDYEFWIFGIDDSDKASFHIYDLEGTLLDYKTFGDTDPSSNLSLRAMDVDGDKIVCVYVEDDYKTIVTWTSSDGGENWSSKSNKTASGDINGIDVCIYDNTLYLAYVYLGSSTWCYTMFGKMAFSGSTWSTSQVACYTTLHSVGIDVIEHGSTWGEYIHTVFIDYSWLSGIPLIQVWARHFYSEDDGSTFSWGDISDDGYYDDDISNVTGMEVDVVSGDVMTMAVIKNDKMGGYSRIYAHTFNPDAESQYLDVEDLGECWGYSPLYDNSDDTWRVYKSDTENNDDVIFYKEWDPDVGWDGSWTDVYYPNFQPDYILAAFDNDEDFIAFGPSGNGTNYILYDDVTPPQAPTNLSISGGWLEHPTLSWDSNTELDFDKYMIYRSPPEKPWFALVDSTTSTSWVDQNVVLGPPLGLWKWYVKAKDYAKNLSPASNTASRWGVDKKIVDGQKDSLIPKKYTLKQNYPNPFNPETKIQFGLPEDSNVKLEIFNLQGQIVATLVDGTFSAGFHTASFGATSLPSGVYFYKIVAGNFTEIKRMLLVK